MLNKPVLTNDKLSLTPLMKPGLIKNTSDKSHKGKLLEIQVYSTYGNDQKVTIKGRVFEKEKRTLITQADSIFKNILRTLRLLSVDEKEDLYVDINFNGKIVKAKTNEEGLFNVKVNDFGLVKPGYNHVQVSLTPGQKKYTADIATGTVTIQPKTDKTYGIVTDIDDTIQKTEVTSLKHLIKNIFFKNYTTQERIPGTPELYQALDKRNDGKIDGDVYYVTGSPINLFPRIDNFIKFNNFPEGSIDLKKIGIGHNADGLKDSTKYKLGRIRTLFDTYPDKKFILFGDSGEKDPEIYKQIAKEYPGRVADIYINNVTNADKNSSRFEGVILTSNTFEAAVDLFQKGLITNEDLEIIRKAVKK